MTSNQIAHRAAEAATALERYVRALQSETGKLDDITTAYTLRILIAAGTLDEIQEPLTRGVEPHHYYLRSPHQLGTTAERTP